MRRRRKRFSYLQISGLLLALLLAVALGFLFFRSPWHTKEIEVGGQMVSYLEAGRGPKVLVLSSGTLSNSKPLLSGLIKDMHLVILAKHSLDVNGLEQFLEKIEFSKPNLILFDRDVASQMKLVSAKPDLFSLLILVGPNLFPDENRSALSIPNSALVLMTREDQLRLGAKFSQVSALLKTVQVGINRSGASMEHSEDWLHEKILNFIQFVGGSKS